MVCAYNMFVFLSAFAPTPLADCIVEKRAVRTTIDLYAYVFVFVHN